MNTHRAEGLIRRALSEAGGGTLFQAEPAGGGPTPVTGKAQSGGTLLPAVNGTGSGASGSAQANLTGQLNNLKKAQDDYHAAGGSGPPAWSPAATANRRATGYSDASDGMGGPGYTVGGRVGGGSSGGSHPVARPPADTVQGTYPSAPRGSGKSNVGSMSRSEDVGWGGGSTAPAGRSRGASRITERRTATIVYRQIDEGNPYTTQPGMSPVGGATGGGGAGSWGQIKPEGATKTVGGGAPAGGGAGSWGQIKPEGATKTGPATGGFGGGGPTAPRPGNTGSMGSGGGGVSGVLSSVGGAVLSTAGRAVGQAIQGNGKVDYSGMARNVGGYAAGTAINGIAKSVMGGGSSR